MLLTGSLQQSTHLSQPPKYTGNLGWRIPFPNSNSSGFRERILVVSQDPTSLSICVSEITYILPRLSPWACVYPVFTEHSHSLQILLGCPLGDLPCGHLGFLNTLSQVQWPQVYPHLLAHICVSSTDYKNLENQSGLCSLALDSRCQPRGPVLCRIILLGRGEAI